MSKSKWDLGSWDLHDGHTNPHRIANVSASTAPPVRRHHLVASPVALTAPPTRGIMPYESGSPVEEAHEPKLLLTTLPNCWVTVFGFPQGRSGWVLTHLARCGTVDDVVVPRGAPTNFMHVKFGSPLQAQQAMDACGYFDPQHCIGIVPCTDMAYVASASSRQKVVNPSDRRGPVYDDALMPRRVTWSYLVLQSVFGFLGMCSAVFRWAVTK